MIFEAPPEGFTPFTEVVGCFILHNGKFLLLKRHPQKLFGGTWGLPGGKLEAHETITHAAVRETLEETSIRLDERALVHLKTVYVVNGSLHYTYHMCRIALAARPSPVLKLDEHTTFSWVTPQESLTEQLIPGQAECIRLVLDALTDR